MNLDITAIVMIVVGLVFAFYGFKVQKLLVIVACFGFGYTLAGEVFIHLITDEKVLLLIQILFGFVGSLLGLKIERLAVFLAVAYLVYRGIGPYLPSFGNEWMRLLVQGGIALIVGALSTMFLKHIIIIASALFGAGMVQQYLPTLISIPTTALTIITIVIAVAGILVQFKTN